jgi:soluble lytic murein transglycosylase-like protein
MSATRNHHQQLRTWTPDAEYRIVCDCQRHAARSAVWSRTVRVASRATALLVGVPLALAFFDIPTKAMNIDISAATAPFLRTSTTTPAQKRSLRIFTTDKVREEFLASTIAPQRTYTLDVVKEEYVRTQVPYGAIIYREAMRNGLAPELVAAMVHTESDFRAGLVSNKSAQGLMQIVPSTARLLKIENPFDPEENIAAGTKYYRYLLDRFNDERIALAAYNAGEGNVERFKGVPPFAETQSYIEKVHTRSSRYRLRVHNTYLAASRLRIVSAQ